jgi:uncharacterized membrane protein YcaP (DUF421 family)
MSERVFFDTWSGLGRTLLIGVLAYAALVLLLRVSGKRTLSKMNAFDLIVTVALGSTLATVLLSQEVALAEGILAFLVLIGLQYILAWTGSRSGTFAAQFLELIKSDPALLLYRGRFLESALRRERVAEVEVLAALRKQGIADPQGVEAVVLETDGTFSVIQKADPDAAGSLRNVFGYPPGAGTAEKSR